MSSSRPDEGIDQFWKTQNSSMFDLHYAERVRCSVTEEEMKKSAEQDAHALIENLRGQGLSPAAFEAEARTIHEAQKTVVRSIEEGFKDRMRSIVKLQRTEKGRLESAHHDALTSRYSIYSVSFPESVSALVAQAKAKATAPIYSGLSNGGAAVSTFPATTSKAAFPPCDKANPTEAAVPATTAAREQNSPSGSGKRPPSKPGRESSHGQKSTVHIPDAGNFKTLPKSPKSRKKSSLGIEARVDSPSIPGSAPLDDNKRAIRTVQFDDVYQNGQAKHKDTIIEYPLGSRKWYILKCERHNIRFTQRPLAGAAKHLNGQPHGGLEKSWDIAIQELGYRVLGCTKALADLNNEVVRIAYEKGYRPVSIINPENKKTKLRSEDAAANSRGVVSRSNMDIKGSSSSSPRERKPSEITSSGPITNPKVFRIYNCIWKHQQYPVLILDWDDQKPGGLDLRLVDTGLLNKKSSPPNCYLYQDAILAWAPGFEDGGLKVHKRKFPAIDGNKGVGWVPAKSLSEFPLYRSDPPRKESHPFNLARQWIAQRKGFSSWGEFEQTRNKTPEEKKVPIRSPSASLFTDNEASDSEHDDDIDIPSSPSNVTEKELQEMQERAGEGSDDSDYTASDVASIVDDEYEAWEEVEADGRPWAFYGLRNKAQDSPRKAEPPSGSTRKRSVKGAELKSSGDEKMRTADIDLVVRSAQGSQSSSGGNSHPEISSRGKPLKESPDQLEKGKDRVTSEVGAGVDGADLSLEQAARQSNSPLVSSTVDNSFLPDAGKQVEHAQAASGVPPSALKALSRSSTGAGDILKGMKRARSEEHPDMDRNISASGPPRSENAKKPRMDIDTPAEPVATCVMSEAPAMPVELSFAPKVPLGPAVFELSSYSKGSISWQREDERSSVRLFYSEGDGTVGSVDGPVKVVIDPTKLRALTQEKLAESKGNSLVTLLGMESDDTPVKIVFDKAKGSKMDIGKIQVRSFIRWIKGINPAIRLLDG
ncbi:hypothetical protein F4777DRAFT_577349 [Nemania sp. FL0916]|nr:hypothetical protein F4777DRAFT_577349 [Nemania sp. FL0916]